MKWDFNIKNRSGRQEHLIHRYTLPFLLKGEAKTHFNILFFTFVYCCRHKGNRCRRNTMSHSRCYPNNYCFRGSLYILYPFSWLLQHIQQPLLKLLQGLQELCSFAYRNQLLILIYYMIICLQLFLLFCL